MKILAISDTHGKIDKAISICKTLSDIDLLIHLGDHAKDGEEISQAVGIDLFAVKGNCDGNYRENDFEILESPYGRILLTHGHMQNVKFSLQNLYYLTLEQNCKAAIFGHTHKPCVEKINDIYLINPGSLSLPANSSKGTYCILNLSKNELSAKIVEYDKVATFVAPEIQKKSKVSGGYLRELLNNSDRF